MLDILNALATEGYVTPTEMASVRSASKNLRESVVRTLRSLNIASSEEIQECFKKYFGFPPLEPRVIESLNTTYQSLLPADLAYEYSVFAIKSENEKLFLAMEDPLDKSTLKQLGFFISMKIVPYVATVEQLVEGLNRIYGWRPEETRLITLIEASRGVFPGNPNETLDETPFLVQGNMTPVWDGSSPSPTYVHALGQMDASESHGTSDSAKDAFMSAVLKGGRDPLQGAAKIAEEDEAEEGSALDVLRRGFDKKEEPKQSSKETTAPIEPNANSAHLQPFLGKVSTSWAVKAPLIENLKDLETLANRSMESKGCSWEVGLNPSGGLRPTLFYEQQLVWESQGIEADKNHPLGRFFLPLLKRAYELMDRQEKNEL